MDEDSRTLLKANKARADEVRAELAERQAPPVVVEPGGRWSPPPMMAAEYEAVHAPQQPPPLPPRTFTDSEIARMFASIQADTDSKIAAALADHDEIWEDVIGTQIAGDRKHRAALLAEIEKLQRAISGDRAADVIDLPNPLRSRRG
ncbi:hypothetical protein [Bradyrhizobium sp. RDM4]|uniref:hypothetical protein n=1 Tax=Bradyrhizobium sp. RDM4 TaxID=3378765 RepID=UPI0038FC4CDF